METSKIIRSPKAEAIGPGFVPVTVPNNPKNSENGGYSPADIGSLNLTGAPPSRGVLPGMFEVAQWDHPNADFKNYE